MQDTFFLAALAAVGGTFSAVTGIWPRRSSGTPTQQKPRRMPADEKPDENKAKGSGFGRR